VVVRSAFLAWSHHDLNSPEKDTTLKLSNTLSARIYQTTFLLATVLSLAIFSSVTTASTTSPGESDWTARKNGHNLQLYTREITGSDFLAVKVTALINAPIEKVANAFGDGDGCNQWQAMCKASTVVEVVSSSERYIHLVLDLPWPFSDRDMVMRSTSTIDPETQTASVLLAAATDKIPLQDYVRARSNGRYTLKVVSDEQVEFTYVMHTDLGGDISPATVNSRLMSTTFEDIKRLVKLAES
jgi:START domain-containing protein